jgi:endonuclease/exonuclease/phosphatase family metal-dependent hydrolase
MHLICWNIQNRNTDDWPRRRLALRESLVREQPDILCVQEAHPEQVDFLRSSLPTHDHAGVGRDDGKALGEHCAILYNRRTFEPLSSQTFWLSDTPDRPGITWGHPYPRICTRVRLGWREHEQELAVFSTHFPLVPEAREKAARLLATRVSEQTDRGLVVVAGDFNCRPGSPPWSEIEAAGLTSAETALGRRGHAPTFHHEGVPQGCIDAVFVNDPTRITGFRVIRDNVDGLYPSDHFGLSVQFDLTA